MHTLMKHGDTYSVGYYQNRGSSPAIFVSLFTQLSFYAAFNTVVALNGGGDMLAKESVQVLEMCQPKESK